MIGVGHHPDSTKVTFPTTLLGNINLVAGASNGSITGIYLQGGMMTAADSRVNYYTLSRCRIADIYLNAQNSNFTYIENIIEGRIASSIGGNSSAKNCSFFNNIVSAFFRESFPFTNSILKNNIFLSQSQCYYGCYYPIAGQYLLLENNIFSGSLYYSNTLNFVSNSVLKNNIFFEFISFPYATNVGSNNIVGQSQRSIFVNQTENTFNYANDYHLLPNSPGKNAGTDDTDIGIYGGIYPWKEGSIPSNPHFQSIQIAPKTDANGNLNVKIKVAAQDR